MHLYVVTRGIKHEAERMMESLSHMYIPMDYNGKKELIQLAVRPVQFWEIVFPEPQLQSILNSLKPGTSRHSDKIMAAVLRKALKSKPIPEIDPNAPCYPYYKSQWVQMIPIGIKKDKFDPVTGNELL